MLALFASSPAAPLAVPAKNAVAPQDVQEIIHTGLPAMPPSMPPMQSPSSPPPPPPGPPLPAGKWVEAIKCQHATVPGSDPPVELASLIFGKEFVSCAETASGYCDDPFYGKLVSALCPVTCKACDTYCTNNNALMEQLSISLANSDPPINWPAYCYAVDEDGFGDVDVGSGSGSGYMEGYTVDEIKMDPIYMVACPAVSGVTGKPMSPKCVPGAVEVLKVLGATSWSHHEDAPVMTKTEKNNDKAVRKLMLSHMRTSLFAYRNATRA